MKKTSSVLLTGAVLVGAASSHVHAQPSSSKRPSSTRAGASRPTPTYEQLKRSLKIDPAVTLDVVRADQASYAGRAIEFAGAVTGMIKAGGVRSVILNVNDSVVRFPVGAEILNGDLLQAGANVRLLALVGAPDNNAPGASSAVRLQPLAVVLAPQSDVAVDTAQGSVLDTINQLPAATDIPIVNSSGSAPMPTIVRPRSNAAVGDRRRRTTASTNTNSAPVAPAYSADDPSAFDSQMPAYRAMVQRFNPRLTPDLVEKIALSLLQAGTANGMDPRFLASIISVESDFDIYSRSSSGAMGLGQLMPFNLKEAGITNAWDPVQNIWGTARLLRGHLNDYRNRADGTLLAVAAYNAGPGAVRRAGYRVPKGSQVQRYVWKVYNRYKEFAPDMFNK
ncbi:MAG TPA: lytic transglycosylase domain-containing protein [Abditibacteriaceae bacterium]|nr:lytic transglycosylase domain-containing protein [Abditibacteriaceae bacterium]